MKIFYGTALSKLKDVELRYKPGVTAAVNVVHKDYKKHIRKLKTKNIKILKGFLSYSSDIRVNTSIVKINKKMRL